MIDGDLCRRCVAGWAAVAAMMVADRGASAGLPAAIYLDDRPALIAASRQGWGEMGIDTAAHAPGVAGLPFRIRDRAFQRGIGSHAPGEIVIELDGDFRSFDAWVGVQWQQGSTGTVVFRAYVDGRKRFDSGVMRETTPAKHLSLSLARAGELRIEMTDAGDGITCDVANLCDARLITDSVAPAARPRERLRVGAFGQVIASDPARADGACSSRVEPFRTEDLFLDEPLIRRRDGYSVPRASDGRSSIGLEWVERRQLTELTLEAAPHISAEGVRVEYWRMGRRNGPPGGSRWQGTWQPLPGRLVATEGQPWRYEIDPSDAGWREGTLKIRWIFPASAGEVLVKSIDAVSNSRVTTMDIRLEAERVSSLPWQLTAYNGILTIVRDGREEPAPEIWDGSVPLMLRLRCVHSRANRPERTTLRFRRGADGFGIAAGDLAAGHGIYVRPFGVFAARISSRATLSSARRRAARDRGVLSRVRRMPDQTFDRALTHVHRPDADLGPTMLSLACHNRKFIVERSGTVRFGSDPDGNPWRFVPVYGAGKATPDRRSLADGWLPFIATVTYAGDVVYRQRTFVAPFDEASPSDLNRRSIGVAEITMENPGVVKARASTALRFLADAEAGTSADIVPRDSRIEVRVDRKLVAIVAGTGLTAGSGAVTLARDLEPGQAISTVVYLLGWDATNNEVTDLPPASDLAKRAADDWRDRIPMRLDLPDQRVRDLIYASQVHCMLAARNDDGTTVAPWIASSHYGPLESEAQSVLRGMAFMGQSGFVRRGLDYFLNRVHPEGYLTTGYTLMGTGWMLWTLGEYYRLTEDRDWLKTAAPTVDRMCRWIAEQRRLTKRTGPGGERIPEYGLMPPGVIADWEVYATYFYVNGTYAAGLRSAGQALKDIGHPGADDILREARELKAETMRAFRHIRMQAPVNRLGDGSWAPSYPTQLRAPGPIGDFYPGEDAGRSWCYDVELGAHHLVPTGVMDPKSPEAGWIIDHMEDVQFLRDGWGYYPAEKNRKEWFNLGGFAKVQPYYARTTEFHALRDDVKPFLRSYFNTAVSLLNREDLSLWEHFFNGAYNKTHETGYFLHQSRTMLLTERGEELWLAPFVTDAWMQDGMTVGVTNAPTAWGSVSYRITSHAAEGYAEATIVPPKRSAPDAIVLRVRHPAGRKIRSVVVNGRHSSNFDAARDIVRLPADGRPFIVRVNW